PSISFSGSFRAGLPTTVTTSPTVTALRVNPRPFRTDAAPAPTSPVAPAAARPAPPAGEGWGGDPGAVQDGRGARLDLHGRARPVVFPGLKDDVDVGIRERVLKDPAGDGDGFLCVEGGSTVSV